MENSENKLYNQNNIHGKIDLIALVLPLQETRYEQESVRQSMRNFIVCFAGSFFVHRVVELVC